MRRGVISLVLVSLIAAALVLWFRGNQSVAPQETEATKLTDALAAETEGWARAASIREFLFPQDHGSHPDYKTEWWYFTGNLQTQEGRRFGYQLTFFRIGLKPETAHDTSNWRAHHIYMAHFALTDVQGKHFHRFERFARAANQLAGAQAEPFAVWLEDWTANSKREFLPIQLQAAQEGVAISLTLNSAKAPVLQGDRGLSQKSAEVGNASYYYSLMRMPTRGEIRINDETFQVSGESWLDREWSTSALGSDQAGWDWFSLQLSDGRELMYYRLRKKDGSADMYSTGTLVDRQGHVTRLSSRDVKLQVINHWTSQETQIRYPVHWRLSLPAHDLTLEVKPLLPQQEMNLSVHYWEGAVDAVGESGGKRITGSGYLELAGYD